MRRLTTEEFITKSNLKHNNKYNYSKTTYTKMRDSVTITCPKHGDFSQKASDHALCGHGCNKCSLDERKELFKKPLKEFIKKSNIIHNFKYDYSKVDYTNNITKVCIICPKHGEFWQRAGDHIRGRGCNSCNQSTGEKIISEILTNLNIKFIPQHRFNGCRDKYRLPFDFFIPSDNLCIEFDGIQHFKPLDYFGGKKAFENLKKRDEIKKNFCKNRNINLLRISYLEEENIEKILTEVLNI